MIELDERLSTARGHARDWARDLRSTALELDRDPDTVHRCLENPAVRHLSTMLIPEPWLPDRPLIGGYRFDGMTAMERVVFAEEIAAGDAGMMLAAPGPSLSGVLIDLLADRDQKEWFYGRMLAAPTWTFFALTEPEHGSDAGAMQTALEPDGEGGLLLRGAKRYIGNGTRASVGVVFARDRPGPLGATAVLVETTAPGFKAEPIPTVGLRGAQLSAIWLDQVPVPAERVLGRHLSPTRRGVWSGVQMFNRLRPGVAAIALGIARSAHEYVAEHRLSLSKAERSRWERTGRRIAGVRQLILRAAAVVDARPSDGHLASAAKARAARLAEEVTLEALDYFGPGARLTQPMLDKLVRDARGVEFMEGTGNIQRLNTFQGLLQGKLDRD
ncbi:acyl-CoA dehydrogenase family protein [Paractinoplanes hotanensis]|uniref:Acyl-CoA/acyl-ACP dehydrogenase n=1 Tax=Paractinoplanes hotanensis TaxID=2906497 RepID=A0ABT0Y6H8_9ACTN|nr:acyl-CoA dehydrogenase family protein [Actinoplanes hotanensis]MCM4081425.1 acyl-CoA/acyl-ACP dehydrogenase [Actinoplanes hotanensis]